MIVWIRRILWCITLLGNLLGSPPDSELTPDAKMLTHVLILGDSVYNQTSREVSQQFKDQAAGVNLLIEAVDRVWRRSSSR